MNDSDRAYKRLREISLGYPGTKELRFDGFTSFTAGEIAFAVFQKVRRRPALTLPLGGTRYAAVLSREGFFPTPQGEGLLVSRFVDTPLDWAFIAEILECSYRATADPGNVALLDGLPPEPPLKLRRRARPRRGDPDDFDLSVKVAVYRHFAETGERPSPADVAARAGAPAGNVVEAYARLRAQRVLVLEDDGVSIRMAPPFSGVPTQHVVNVQGVSYFANCAWDSLGIVAALGKPGVVYSRCERSKKPLRLAVGVDGPEPCDWWFHCAVPAAQWWNDIVFT